MHWADEIAKKIIDSGKYQPYWVDDMKTPSGYAHIGSMLGPIIHSCIFRALTELDKKAKLTYVFNDFDPADEFPPAFKTELAEHAGKPLKTVPSPEPAFDNLAEMLADDLKKSLTYLGFEAEYLSSWKMYHEGKFDEVIKLALDNSSEIQDIYKRISGSQKKQKGWLPFQVICEKCQKLGTTRVFDWDGKEVCYKCEPEMVSWAKGCGYEGKVSPFGGTGKLPWKVDWAAHWKVMGVTIEGAGKDHASAGGSYDIAMEICEKIFKFSKPYKFPYEFLLIGGKKMSSSKGIGLKAHDLVKILPPQVARFLFVSADIGSQSNFDPYNTMAIPDLFDKYDEGWLDFNNGKDTKAARSFELSQLTKANKSVVEIPRFRDVASQMQLLGEANLASKYPKTSKDLLQQRIKYAKYWLEHFAPSEFKIELVGKADLSKLDKDQIDFLREVVQLTQQEKDPEKLQMKLYDKTKEMQIDAKKAFCAIYLALLGQNHGPKAGWFLLEYKHGIIRLKEALDL